MQSTEITKSRISGPDALTVSSLTALFELELYSQGQSSIETWLERVAVPQKGEVFAELLQVEVRFHQKNNTLPSRDHYCDRFPDFVLQIQTLFEVIQGNSSKSSGDISMVSTMDETKPYRAFQSHSRNWIRGETVGRYRLDEFIGRGGFGEVWKGFDPELNRVVAIKVPREEPVGDSENSQMFLEEARRAAVLKHEGIVPVFDVGRVGTAFFIVSEFIDGPTLTQRMQSETISRDEAIRIIRTLALILHKAHQAGLIHRDIKPSNILMRKDGTPTITDFGLAVSEEDQLSLERGIVGTIAYMSPEQARGETRLMDGRSDLYSLGVILFQLLTGRMPFQHRNIDDLLEQIRNREVRSLRSIDDSIPAALDVICLKCLSKEIRNRYSTGHDLAADLEAWNRPKGVSRRIAFIAVAAVVLVILIEFSTNARWWRNEPTGSSSAAAPVHASDSPSIAASVSPPILAEETPSREWLPMLDQPLEKVVSLKGLPTDFLQQDTATNTLTARAEDTFWVLATRRRGKSPLRIRSSVFMDNWVGSVGFVWGLSQSRDTFPKTPPRGYACVIERFHQTDPLILAIREVQIQECSTDVLCVGMQTGIVAKTIAIPEKSPASLEFGIDESGINILIDGVNVWSSVNKQRPILNDLITADGQIGIMLRGKTVVVRDAAVKFLKSQTSQ